MWIGIVLALGVAVIGLAVWLFKTLARLRQYHQRFTPVFDQEAELRRLGSERVELEETIRTTRARWEVEFPRVIAELEDLNSQVDHVRDQLELESFGLYEPVFDFQTSEKYREAVKQVRSQQKDMVRGEQAAVCDTTWTVEGSASKGKQMTKRNLKLQLRAFNGDCDAAIAKATFSNVKALGERIEKSWAAINKLGETSQCRITQRYLQLKLDELHLAYELARKREEEKEEQRQIREQMREEERARKEIEKAQKQAEKEEARYAAALEQARREYESADSAAQQALRKKIELLEKQFEEAHDRRARAISRAQLTRSGHVYIISNVGSFGDQVFKIGMTRRLEPLDRVKELGDASVPFPFDVHAMIYSADAPTLEASLHKHFEGRQINLINTRREFFNVSLDEIEHAVRGLCGDQAEFIRVAIADEFRESQAIRAKRAAADKAAAEAAQAKEVVEARNRFEELRKEWRAEPVG